MAQAPLPTPRIDILTDVQGDVVIGFPKKKQEFVFFEIKDGGSLKRALARLEVTTTADVVAARAEIAQVRQTTPGVLAPVGFLNIAFSKKGLDALGVQGDIGDKPFNDGQLNGASDLGDTGTVIDGKFDPEWETAFKKLRIDGVLVLAGESWKSVKDRLDHATNVLGQSIRIVYTLKGSVRPGEEKGHEHFGWEDGISNPAVVGVGFDGQGNTLPGQRPIPPGVILRGLEGDFVSSTGLPAWAKAGSFLVFRQLEQLVPEFLEYLKLEAFRQGLDPVEGADLLGARLVGRWKSGAPIQLTEDLKDNKDLAGDKQRNNDFKFPQVPGDEGQELCPYAAHIRKTNPRNDIDDVAPKGVEKASIIRAGIPYGPELTFDEKQEHVSELERGLAFVCYQSSIENGFKFMQKSWANNQAFPPRQTKQVTAGFDPIIGQHNGAPRDTWGVQAGGFKVTGMPEFVKSRGGEYFFSPPIHALKNGFAN